MQHHLELSDSAFELQFSNCLLDPKLFTHEAHLRLAWIHIHQYGVPAAILNIKEQLQRYVDHLGAQGKYNETVTVAAIKAVNHFILKSRSRSFQDFIEEFPRLKYNFKELMGFHYDLDVFASVEAKRRFMEPTILPFD